MNPGVMTRPAEMWNTVYDNDTAPWVIGAPQPAIVALEKTGLISGRVLDPGCGAGEHTILLTELGYDVLGVDLAPSAVEYARRNAADHGVAARFEVADALRFGERTDWAGVPAGSAPAFDTIVDSALFHVFGTEPEARAEYVNSLHSILKPGGLLHILALSDAEPGIGPRISDTLIRESFGTGWELEDLQPSRYLGRPIESAQEGRFDGIELGEGTIDVAAWLTRLRRI